MSLPTAKADRANKHSFDWVAIAPQTPYGYLKRIDRKALSIRFKYLQATNWF